ncbi:MAG: carbohydrate ABC transporter permease [Chloroflexi bacterium]|nr:carbohydrate ABC transporter permease [Chloroflexota bacterium]
MTTKTVSNSTLAVQDQTEQQHTANSWFTFHGDWPIAIILTILGVLTFIPLIMLLELSFKSQQQMADAMWLPSWPLYVKNYVKAWSVMQPYMVNSFNFSLGAVTISIVCSVLSAYVLARYDFPGREFFYIAILALLMIPGVLTLITAFVVTVNLKLNNTYWGVWLPLAAGAQAFQIIVLRTFFASLPGELFEAGRIDGASESTMLLRIALPLAKPILSTLIVLQILSVWNEFIWPIMVLSDPTQYPAILGILRLGSLVTDHDPGAMYAGYVISGIPLLLLFAFTSRSFIRGLTSGAIKM